MSGDAFFRMGRGCEITKHLKIAHKHLFYYSDVFDVGMFVWEKMVGWWLYEGFLFCAFIGMALKVGNEWKEHG
jgi:hypothetical protein